MPASMFLISWSRSLWRWNRAEKCPFSAFRRVISWRSVSYTHLFELYPGQRAEGEIILDGENLLTAKTDISLIRAKVGMVFQKPTPVSYTHLDVYKRQAV